MRSFVNILTGGYETIGTGSGNSKLIFSCATPDMQICLSCTNKKCNGECKRYKEEKRKLKETKQK